MTADVTVGAVKPIEGKLGVTAASALIPRADRLIAAIDISAIKLTRLKRIKLERKVVDMVPSLGKLTACDLHNITPRRWTHREAFPILM